ncbi:ABC transporter substrate-binding protein [Oscillospiraceae bacterium OttesenSCG-928-F05]|nr:ABC transporter substrate-binding protein [Oscillospiraceae bacterium OttesenSCG-928-F05]
MAKKLTCLALALVMVFALAACGDGSPAQTPGGTQAPATQAPANTATPEPAEDPVQINLVAIQLGAQDDLPLVTEEINKILLAEANTTFNLNALSISAFREQINLMFAAQEKIDLVMTGASFFFADHAGKGYYEPLNDLLDTHGQGVKEKLTEKYYAAARSADGNIYGITPLRDLAFGRALEVRKDLIDKYNLDFSGVKSVPDAEAIFQTIKENEPDLIPVGDQISYNLATGWPGIGGFDTLGGTDGIGLTDPLNSLEVSLLSESDIYMGTLLKIRDFYLKGYLPKDGVTDETTGQDFVKAGRMFAYNTNYHANSNTQARDLTGMEMSEFQTLPIRATTATVTGFMWAIPIFAESPAASMKTLDVMYTNEAFMNLICWGIEGKHYVWNDAHTHIDYPEGVSGDNVGFKLGVNWIWGNQFLTYPWEGAPTDTWDRMNSDNLNAEVSLATGFTFDTTNVKTQYSGVAGVVDEFQRALYCGMSDPETVVPEFVSKLKSVGAEDIIAEKQAQLDTWAANQ